MSHTQYTLYNLRTEILFLDTSGEQSAGSGQEFVRPSSSSALCQSRGESEHDSVQVANSP